MDSTGNLRIVSGAHRVGGDYALAAGQTLETPLTLWLFSADGAGAATRALHRWARRYAVRQPALPRPVLLNNWEATGMQFDEARLEGLFEDAKGIGFDTFLLDDGWFGNKHQRDDARRGLGDWEVAGRKLPRGLGHLCAEAERRGFNFGIWLEPEMISPASELYEQHPDWALGAPGRAPVLGRWQMVLDLANPAVADFVWQAVERTLRPHPVKYVKWDANSCVYQPGSRWLGAGRQGNLDFDYNTALLAVMRRMAREFPQIPGMLCAGGGGRADYAALANFTSFWLSDNTDPLRRVFIQWGFSYFFPPETQSAHVTRMGHRPLKFAVDVALAGALGFDLDISRVTPEERAFFRQTIALYKRDLRPVTSGGEYYRLVSPYAGPRAATLSVTPARDRAVLFVYQTADAADGAADGATVPLRGLDAAKTYTISEVSLPDGLAPRLPAHGARLTGAELLAGGLTVPLTRQCDSAVVLLTADHRH
ncbi:MAG: alpha-galactosidase [Verrucomicrobiales bacterium]|nr:alpha-galactosidase [Verrucomicrobiales bacterium]